MALPKEYAAKTDVPVEKTRAEIVRLLRAHGATKVAPLSDYEARREILMFELANRRIRFTLRFPDPASDEVAYVKPGYRRAKGDIPNYLAQVERTKWRKLLLLLKAKLESVRDGTVTLEDEFLAQTVLSNNQTVGEWARAQIDRAMIEGRMPPLLPSGE